MATVEEVNLARDIRRVFAKKPIDSGRLEIQCIRGRIYISGIITAQREAQGVIVKNEVAAVIEQIQKMSGVKQVFNECRVKEPEVKKKPGHEEHHAAGGGHGPSSH